MTLMDMMWFGGNGSAHSVDKLSDRELTCRFWLLRSRGLKSAATEKVENETRALKLSSTD